MGLNQMKTYINRVIVERAHILNFENEHGKNCTEYIIDRIMDYNSRVLRQTHIPQSITVLIVPPQLSEPFFMVYPNNKLEEGPVLAEGNWDSHSLDSQRQALGFIL